MPRYCRAYPADRLREYGPLDQWLNETAQAAQAEILYVWEDLRVVADPLSDEPSFTSPDPGWRAFCEEGPAFSVPPGLTGTRSP